MRRIFVLGSVLLLSTMFAVAQYGASSSSNKASSKTTIEGCLGESNGNFTLTDNAGTVYQLTGNTAKLKKHVGHTVRVMGRTESAANEPGSMSNQENQSENQGAENQGAENQGAENQGAENQGAAAQPSQPTFSVSSFRHISSKCNTPR